jgi:hypothetical protein
MTVPCSQRLHPNDHQWHPDGRHWHPNCHWRHPNGQRWHLDSHWQHPGGRWQHLDGRRWHWHDSVTSSPGQTTPSHLLAQGEDPILHAKKTELDSIRTIVRRVHIREENLYTFLTLLFSQYLYADPTRCHISMVVSSAMAMLPWQRHRQHDSAPTSHRGQVLSSTITSMTQQRYHPTANVVSIVLSPA